MAKTTRNHFGALINEVASISQDRKLRLTPIRREILRLMAKKDRAVGAYELLADLQKSDPQSKIITVYRALEFLREHGFIHRIESLNAFVVCWHPEHRHDAQLIICDHCGDVEEVEVPGIAEQINKKAKAAGFTKLSQTIEVHGLCRDCSSA